MNGNRSAAIAAMMCAILVAAACGRSADLSSRCDAFASDEFEGVAISASAVVADREDLPAFCQVQGTIDPNVGFEARFPLADWNGKFYQSGCGGFCGMVLPDKLGFSNTINEALKRGFAAITTNGGHEGSIGDASWAQDNPEAVEIYGHRVIPLTHHAGTAMTAAFYGKHPSREYFGGCSNGGRLAAMAAQRYPDLFDGILGGCGVLELGQSGGIYGSWMLQANTDENGQRLLTRANFADRIPLLEQAVLEQCDAVDGNTDGLISMPRECNVDVDLLPACDEGSDACFTEIEKRVLRAWYQGPRTSSGKQLKNGVPPGGERYLGFWFLDPDDGVAVGNQLGGGFAKYLGFEGGTPDDYTALDFDFDVDPQRLGHNSPVLDALDPDLGAFRDAGGKYLMWHGWGDALVLPDQSLAYYESVAATMGGYDAVQPFFRLFLIPGSGHCWEMSAGIPDRFDPITVLDEWVETGMAPESIRARLPGSDGASSGEELVLYPHPASAMIPAAVNVSISAGE